MPLLSIIIPCYNAEIYINKCVDTILSNTFSDWELLLIDDGSADGGKYLEIFPTLDDRIKVIHKENGGVSSARNLGLRLANGEWVTFIDADDYISDDYLAALVRPLAANPQLEFIHAGCSNYYQQTGEISVNQSYDTNLSPTLFDLFDKCRGLVFSKLFKKQIISCYSIAFDERMKVGEDLVFTMDYLTCIRIGAFISNTGYYYRRHSQSTTGKRRVDYAQKLYEYKASYRAISSCVEAFGLTESQRSRRRRLLGNELFNLTLDLFRGKYTKTERLYHLRTDSSAAERNDVSVKKLPLRKRTLAWLFKNGHFDIFDITVRTINYLHLL